MLTFCLHFSEAKKQEQDWEEEQEELVMILDSTQEDN